MAAEMKTAVAFDVIIDEVMDDEFGSVKMHQKPVIITLNWLLGLEHLTRSRDLEQDSSLRTPDESNLRRLVLLFR
uniref:Uncharacterized protein n=1 Tax=Syphacia muris TaxID=451379 RepID=A0A0N5ATA1_9BILA